MICYGCKYGLYLRLFLNHSILSSLQIIQIIQLIQIIIITFETIETIAQE